jgi:uncharacterized membrane protein YdjX (TVP38/TMEM64 family)
MLVDHLLQWFKDWGELTPLTSVSLAAVFIIASFGVPRLFLTVGAGAVFGPWSLLVIQPSTTIGALLAFLFARYLFADRLQRRFNSRNNSMLRIIANAIDSEGWRIVALIRLASPIPGPVANYLFGLTRIGVWPYTLATFIFTFPQTIIFVYVGAAGRAALVEEASSPLKIGLMLAGCLCLCAVTFLVSRKARVAVRSLEQGGQPDWAR